MAFACLEGFQGYTGNPSTSDLQQALSRQLSSRVSLSGTSGLVAGRSRGGFGSDRLALVLKNSTDYVSFPFKPTGSSTAVGTVGFAFKSVSLPASESTFADIGFAATDSYTSVRLTITGSTLKIYSAGATLRSTVNSVFTADTWAYIEIRFDIDNGYTVNVNGSEVASYSGTLNAVNESSHLLLCGASEQFCFDDLYTRGDEADFLGPNVVVDSLYPTSDAQSNWSCTNGTDRFAIVDGLNAFDSISNTTSGQTQRFGMSSLAGTKTVEAVEIRGTFWQAGCKPYGVVALGSDSSIELLDYYHSPSSGSYYGFHRFYETTPAGDPWDMASLADTTFGVAHSTQSASTLNCYEFRVNLLSLGSDIQSISQSAEIDDELGLQQVSNRSIANGLLLSFTADFQRVREIIVTASSGLSLSDRVMSVTFVTSSLTLSDSVDAEKTRPCASDFSPSDGVVLNATRTIGLRSGDYPFVDADGNYIADNPWLIQALACTFHHALTVSQGMTLDQRLLYTLLKATATMVTAASNLTMSDQARFGPYEIVATACGMTQAATASASKPAGQVLTVTQNVGMAKTLGRATTDVLAVRQAVAMSMFRKNVLYQYAPSIGSTSDPNAPIPPSTSIHGPIVGITAPFQLIWPNIGEVTEHVTLRAPNLGNRERLSFNRISRETRGGTLKVFADPRWPRSQRLVLSFSGLHRAEARSLLSFIERRLGQQVGLLDWEHRYWTGLIVSVDEPIVQDAWDQYSASFEFEGELDPAWNPQILPYVRSGQTRPSDGPSTPYVPVTDWMLQGNVEYYSVETDATLRIGMPLYLTIGNYGRPARADAVATMQVAGVAVTDADSAETVSYASEGRVTREDWTSIAGSALLDTGALYFLSPSIAGHITSAAPTAPGTFVCPVGRAVSPRTLDVEIGVPIRL